MSAEEVPLSYEITTLDEVFGEYGLDVELERIANVPGILPARIRVLRAGGSAVIRVDLWLPDQWPEDPMQTPVGGITWQRWDDRPDVLYWYDVSVHPDYRHQGFIDHFSFNIADFLRERMGIRYVSAPDVGIVPTLHDVLEVVGFEWGDTGRGEGWIGDLEPGSRHMEYVRWRQGLAPEPAWRG